MNSKVRIQERVRFILNKNRAEKEDALSFVDEMLSSTSYCLENFEIRNASIHDHDISEDWYWNDCFLYLKGFYDDSSVREQFGKERESLVQFLKEKFDAGVIKLFTVRGTSIKYY